uniref:Uncharacterized protein n=1 Tax=Branchiostoma floridae TaxID=7739 RepID=C3ZTR5_BRAFL|eukprot:XP_002588052.1 hypothetical protein BRAFLDRAFT_83033 [Branchiostoma floridae]
MLVCRLKGELDSASQCNLDSHHADLSYQQEMEVTIHEPPEYTSNCDLNDSDSRSNSSQNNTDDDDSDNSCSADDWNSDDPDDPNDPEPNVPLYPGGPIDLKSCIALLAAWLGSTNLSEKKLEDLLKIFKFFLPGPNTLPNTTKEKRRDQENGEQNNHSQTTNKRSQNSTFVKWMKAKAVCWKADYEGHRILLQVVGASGLAGCDKDHAQGVHSVQLRRTIFPLQRCYLADDSVLRQDGQGRYLQIDANGQIQGYSGPDNTRPPAARTHAELVANGQEVERELGGRSQD